MQQAIYNFSDFLSDSRTAGKPGRFDSRAVDKSGSVFQFFNDKNMSVFVRAKTGKRSDYLTVRYAFYVSCRLLKHLIQPVSCCVCAFLFLDINGSRADQQIAVHRRRYEHSFSEFIRQREDRAAYMVSGCVVQKAVITPAGRDMDLLFADHIVKYIGIDPGSVDNDFRFVITLTGVYFPDAVLMRQAGHFCVEMKFCSVYTGIFCQRDIQAERTDDSAGGSEQSGTGFFADVWLHLS